MIQSARRSEKHTLRVTAAFTSTESWDLGYGAMDGFDALLVHYAISSYSTGNVTIKCSAIPDSIRALTCDNAAWTTAALSANAQGTLILNAPLPRDVRITATGASTPSMNLTLFIEKVKTGH